MGKCHGVARWVELQQPHDGAALQPESQRGRWARGKGSVVERSVEYGIEDVRDLLLLRGDGAPCVGVHGAAAGCSPALQGSAHLFVCVFRSSIALSTVVPAIK